MPKYGVMVHQKNFPFHDKDAEDDYIYVTRRGRGFGAKLLGTVFVFSILGVVGWFGYMHFKPQNAMIAQNYSESGLPLIKASEEPFKGEPEQPGGMQIPNLDKQIYNKVDKTMGFAIDGQEENLEIMPNRDELLAEIAEQQGKKEEIHEIITKKNTTAAASAQPAKPADTPEEAKAKRIDVDKVLAKAEPSQIWVQLGTFEDENEATKAWQEVRENNSDVLSNVGTRVTKSETAEGIYYRLQSGPLYSAEEAEALCKKLNERQQSCFYAKKDQ